ncbi:hypothetical protein J1614_006857 [Plenodomus biglobosus]|nr:hypothetical protein J1614_006857 [Plenodomus biglobosus]
MVTTRRTAANAVAATQLANGTRRVVYKNKTISHTVDFSTSNHNTSPDSISEHDLSLTSPTPSRSLSYHIMDTPGQDVQSPFRPDTGPALIRPILAPKPHGVVGSVNNPINMLEDSPPKKSAQAPAMATKRKYPHYQLLEPHMFVDKGYRKLYSYRQSRPALVPKPANGTTFTGHKNQDVYRAMNTKIAAVSETNPSRGPDPLQQAVPFEVQFPMSARFLAKRAATNPMVLSFIQQHGVQVPATTNALNPAHDEALLRKKAIHTSESEELAVVRRKTTKPSTPQTEINSATSMPKAMSIPNVDPHTTPGPTKSSSASTPALPSARQKGKLPIHRDVSQTTPTTPNQAGSTPTDLAHLIEYTTLLMSLMQLYPTSHNQSGLRHDIALLASINTQHLEAWQKSEAAAATASRKKDYKHAGSNVGGYVSARNKDYTGRGALLRKRKRIAAQAAETARAQTTEARVRNLLSAGAGLWQDGSGEGVADVFAVEDQGRDEGGQDGGGEVVEEVAQEIVKKVVKEAVKEVVERAVEGAVEGAVEEVMEQD